MSRPIVVKVGGSLFDWPKLKPALAEFLAQVSASPVILVAGGGASVDVVRELDCVHTLGEEASHRIALQAMTVNAMVLREWFPEKMVPDTLLIGECLDACWSTTSDSIAARIAVIHEAEQLILLKSADPPGATVKDWAAAGYVDPLMQCVLSGHEIAVAAVNLRKLNTAPAASRSSATPCTTNPS